MANAGPRHERLAVLHHRGDAQPALNGGYTIFGQCDPLSLVAEIARVETGARDKPVKDVVMTKVTIARGKKGGGKAAAKDKAKAKETRRRLAP